MHGQALPVIRLPSASRLELLDYCRHFPKLVWDQTPPGEAALNGTFTHKLIELDLRGERPDGGIASEGVDVEKCLKIFARWKAWWGTYAGDRLWFPEVVFLYNVRTGAVRAAGADWQEEGRPRGADEIPAIVDALTVADGKGYAIDWKTGKLGGAPAAAVNPQLALAAVCISKFFGVSEVDVSLGWLRQIKDPMLDTATLNALDLYEWEQRNRENCDAIPAAEPNPGQWCWKCPGKANCPEVGRKVPEGVEGIDFPPW